MCKDITQACTHTHTHIHTHTHTHTRTRAEEYFTTAFPLHALFADVCSKIDEMAEYINEHLRVQENTRRIMEIQKSLTGQNLPPLVAPGRRIIREGRLMKVGKWGESLVEVGKGEKGHGGGEVGRKAHEGGKVGRKAHEVGKWGERLMKVGKWGERLMKVGKWGERLMKVGK